MKLPILFFLTLFSISLISALSVDIPISTNYSDVNTNHSLTSDYATSCGTTNCWSTAEGVVCDVVDISHADLSDLAWSVAGHTIDDDIDMNDNTLTDISYMVLSGGGYFADFDGDLNIASDLSPTSSLYYSLGSGALRWLWLYVQNISAEHIDTYTITASDNITTSEYFIGDGSYLTGVGETYYSDEEWINKNDSNGFIFNASKLATIYYNASQPNAVAGVIDGGTIADTQHQDGNYDDVTFNFSEQAGSPALDLRMNFTNIEDFNQGIMRYKTSGLSGDYPIIYMWDYDSEDWDEYPAVAESENFATIVQPVFDSADHILNGVAQMRIYKAGNGNTNNHYYVDWVAVSKGYGTPSGNEVDPFSIHTYAINTTQMNYTGGQLNILESWLTTWINTFGFLTGNYFDQSLNTTDNPTFNNLTLTENLNAGKNITGNLICAGDLCMCKNATSGAGVITTNLDDVYAKGWCS